jgi:hypothetical protein
VELRKSSFCQQRGSEANGLGVAVEELEEGVLAHLFNVLEGIDLEELVILFSVDFPWHLFEEKGLRLRLSQLAELVKDLRAEVDLPSDRIPVRKDEGYIDAVFHYDFR